MSTIAHDEDRCALIYMRCKSESVGYARQLLASAGSQNRYLCAFDAEELYDTAWETYYARGEYLEDTDDHIARINAVILSRFRDERRRSKAQKRTLPGRPVDLTAGNHPAAPGRLEDRVVDRDELRQRLALIRNPEDRQALIDHDLHGLTFEEIGERAGITAEAARRRAQRARNQAAAQPVRSGPGYERSSAHSQGQNDSEQGELW